MIFPFLFAHKKGLFFTGGENMKESTLNTKKELVQNLVDELKASKSAVVANVIGLTVAEVSELRTNLYNAGCKLRVIKNNIIRRAVNEAGYQGLDELLVGPNAVAFSSDAQSAAKIMYDFAKDNEKVEIKAGVVEGEVFNANDLKVLANLPGKEGMVAMLLSVLQAPIRNVACVIKAVADKENN